MARKREIGDARGQDVAALMNPLHQTNTHVSVRGHFSESTLQYGNKLKVVISLMGVITKCDPESFPDKKH